MKTFITIYKINELFLFLDFFCFKLILQIIFVLADEEMQLISNCDPRSHLTWYMTEKNLSVNKLIENNAGSNHLLSLCQLKQFLKVFTTLSNSIKIFHYLFVNYYLFVLLILLAIVFTNM